MFMNFVVANETLRYKSRTQSRIILFVTKKVTLLMINYDETEPDECIVSGVFTNLVWRNLHRIEAHNLRL